jgi:hypothetical protein
MPSFAGTAASALIVLHIAQLFRGGRYGDAQE